MGNIVGSHSFMKRPHLIIYSQNWSKIFKHSFNFQVQPEKTQSDDEDDNDDMIKSAIATTLKHVK
jgi:hypothetical protein